jgi:hypothetical protein
MNKSELKQKLGRWTHVGSAGQLVKALLLITVALSLPGCLRTLPAASQTPLQYQDASDPLTDGTRRSCWEVGLRVLLNRILLVVLA